MNQSINEEMETLNSMIEVIKKSNPIYHPSLFWENLNKINLKSLQISGYSNFKRTVSQNYFNPLIVSPRNDLFKSVFLKWLKNPKLEIFTTKFEGDKYIETPGRKFKLNMIQQFFYKLFVSMLWEYTQTVDKENLLESIEEPIEGNPLRIFYKGRLISQYLCNSVLEYYSIMYPIPPDERENLTIAELGGGYGRGAFVFMKSVKCKYVLFDIPPALYISQRYLSAVFPKLKIFKFRDFKKYSEIKSEYENADICFFTPNQMELLPKRQFDVFINISSLHEMTLAQIKHYFHLINEHCNGYFFTKQWLNWTNIQDNLTISYKDYPVPSNWKLIFFRRHPIRTRFFEALYYTKKEASPCYPE